MRVSAHDPDGLRTSELAALLNLSPGGRVRVETLNGETLRVVELFVREGLTEVTLFAEDVGS